MIRTLQRFIIFASRECLSLSLSFAHTHTHTRTHTLISHQHHNQPQKPIILTETNSNNRSWDFNRILQAFVGGGSLGGKIDHRHPTTAPPVITGTVQQSMLPVLRIVTPSHTYSNEQRQQGNRLRTTARHLLVRVVVVRLPPLLSLVARLLRRLMD